MKPTYKTLRAQAANLLHALQRAHGRCIDGGGAAHRDVRAFYGRAYTKAEAELNAARAAMWGRQRREGRRQCVDVMGSHEAAYRLSMLHVCGTRTGRFPHQQTR